MSTVVYDSLVGDASQQISVSSTSTLGYPSSNMYNVFGPVYLPRIYGKDLTSFEIASSGKIAITLQDTFAFNLDRDVANSVTSLATVAGDSFQIQANSNLVNLTFDAASNNMALTASNTLHLTAQNIVYDISKSSTMNIGGDYNIAAACNIGITAGSNVDIYGGMDVLIASQDSNVILHMDHTACNLVQYALHDVIVAASNDFQMEALSNASLSALHGSLFLGAASSNVLLTLDASQCNLEAYAAKDVTLTASNDVSFSGTSNATLEAVQGLLVLRGPDASISMSSNVVTVAQESVLVTASNGVQVQALSNASMSAGGQLLLVASDSNVSVKLDSGSMLAYTQQNVTFAASNNFAAEALSNASLSAVHGSLLLSAADSNVFVTLDSTACNLIEYAQKNITLAASNALHLEALSNASLSALQGAVYLSAAYSNVFLTLDDATLAATLSAKSNLSFSALNGSIASTAYSNVTIAATQASMALSADTSNVTLTLDQPTHSLLAYSLCNVSLTSGRNFTVSASNSAIISSKSNLDLSAAAGAATLTLGADSTIQSSAATFAFIAASNAGFSYDVGGSNVLNVQSDKVTVNGDLEILGVLNSIAVQETELHINDKVVELAYPNPGENITDGTLNSDAGMVVYGLPEAAAGVDATGRYDKSFKWNYGSAGIDDMLTSSVSTEAFWELKGGRFQMSSTKADGKKISFALRINEHDELEFVKMWDDAEGTPITRKIAKFGRTL